MAAGARRAREQERWRVHIEKVYTTKKINEAHWHFANASVSLEFKEENGHRLANAVTMILLQPDCGCYQAVTPCTSCLSAPGTYDSAVVNTLWTWGGDKKNGFCM